MNISTERVNAFSLPSYTFEYSTRGRAIIDKDLKILQANKRFRDSFQLPAPVTPDAWPFDLRALVLTNPDFLKADLLGAATLSSVNVKLALPAADPDTADEQAHHEAHQYQVEAVFKDHEVTHFELTERKDLDVQQKFIAAARQLQRERERAIEAQAAKQAAEQQLEDIEAFSRIALHDLKSPLASILGILEWVSHNERDLISTASREMVDSATQAAKRLIHLISSLLGRANLNSHSLDLVTLDLQPVFSTLFANLTFTDNIDAEIRFDLAVKTLRGDELLTLNLFENLLSNAVKYRKPGRKLVVTVSSSRAPDDTIVLEVADNGTGFNNANATSIFRAFERFDDENTAAGHGLGLANCRTICNRHNWAITAAGQPGEGATFQIRIPAETQVSDYHFNEP